MGAGRKRKRGNNEESDRTVNSKKVRLGGEEIIGNKRLETGKGGKTATVKWGTFGASKARDVGKRSCPHEGKKRIGSEMEDIFNFNQRGVFTGEGEGMLDGTVPRGR